MLSLHYGQLERVNSGPFPEHPNNSNTENVWERMANVLRRDGIYTHSSNWGKTNPTAGKDVVRAGGTGTTRLHV